MNKETRYRLASGASVYARAEVSSHGDFQTLAGALAAAWANAAAGARPLGITCGGLPVMSEEDLRRALERLRAVESECRGDNRIGCAA